MVLMAAVALSVAGLSFGWIARESYYASVGQRLVHLAVITCPHSLGCAGRRCTAAAWADSVLTYCVQSCDAKAVLSCSQPSGHNLIHYVSRPLQSPVAGRL